MTAPGPLVGHGVVAWADTDASGWIHFTAPLRWVEEAEHRLYRSAAVGVDPGRFPRRDVRSGYVAPLRAGDPYEVRLSAGRVGTTSVTYEWTVHSHGRLRVEGTHTAVHLGDDGRPAAVPASLRTLLTAGLREDS